MDLPNSPFTFVRVDQFTPNSRVNWISFGPVSACTRAGNVFTLTGVSPRTGVPAPVLLIYILGPKAFRVRFNPKGGYTHDGSFAVVNNNLGQAAINVLQQDKQKLSVDLGGIRLDVLFQPMTIAVYLNGHMISADTDQGLVYIPGQEVTANFKNYPANANYFGFGEKGGNTLRMNETSMTFFNYDNFKYGGGAPPSPGAVVPSNPGPLNPSEPLYNSIPLLIEDNPNPLDANGQPTNSPYSYGIFLDNESQSYFNIGASTAPGDMYGKYYFGALYGEIDYYFMAGRNTAEVIQQYVTLTGPPALPPMWVLGYHQGCYGYYDHNKVMAAAMAYRAARIPIDGMHIDVDFQNNYRTFTASPKKFPNGGADTFQALAATGIKASTNITGIVTMQPLDEDGKCTPYPVLQSGIANNAFFVDAREGGPPGTGLYVTNESYGCNEGSNPYPSPGAPVDPNCNCGGCVPLGTYGHYADLGKLDVRAWWGTLYKPLLDAGLEMVWQDMTDPATQPSISSAMPWKTLALDLLVYDFTTDSMTAHARIHNVFALNLISATYEGLVALRKASGVDKRPFIIARGGYAGVQLYAATWTGDSASDWNFLSILIPQILNFGLSGQPLSGADVGGFATSSVDFNDPANGTQAYGNPKIQNGQVVGGITDPELLVRWTTMSAFFGWFRNHYDGYNKQYQEPYAYGEPYTSMCRKYIEIRYKLLQLFYDALYESTQTGIPICRPMFLTDRSDPNVYQEPQINNQFMVGQNLLIAPVTQRYARSRAVYLPAGSSWFAYTDSQAPLAGPSPGGQSVNWNVPLDLVPMCVRAGAIIPRRELEQYVGQLPQNPLTFDIYPGPDSTYNLYLDDKVSTQAQANGVYRLTEISQFLRTGAFRVQTVNVVRKYDKFTPAENYYFVAMLGTSPPVSVAVNGNPVSVLAAGSDSASAAQLAASTVNAYYYSTSLQTTFVKVFDPAAQVQAQIVGTFNA